MSNEFYRKLVDLYAGRELPQELEEEMEMAAFGDQSLSYDMASLRKTVDLLKSDSGAAFSEESYQRTLMKLYAKGANIQPQRKEPAHLQYHLPIQV